MRRCHRYISPDPVRKTSQLHTRRTMESIKAITREVSMVRHDEDGVAERRLEVIKSTNRHLLRRDTTEQRKSFQNAVGRHPQYFSVHLLSYHRDRSITWCVIVNDQVDTEPCKQASISRTSFHQPEESTKLKQFRRFEPIRPLADRTMYKINNRKPLGISEFARLFERSSKI